jgi:hypothetical protein
MRQLQDLASKPDELGVEFGIKFTAEAGALIAKTALEGNIKISLKWAAPKQRSSFGFQNERPATARNWSGPRCGKIEGVWNRLLDLTAPRDDVRTRCERRNRRSVGRARAAGVISSGRVSFRGEYGWGRGYSSRVEASL